MGPCAKQTVECIIIDNNGQQFYGSNACLNPQKTCPREPGEGYEKCKSICDQLGHAEEMALWDAQSNEAVLVDASAIVTGHTYACKDCQELLYSNGIRWISVQ